MPHLRFFCELDATPLRELFARPEVVEDLRALGAGVTLGLRDLSDERAQVVRRLNEAGVAVGAWLLLPAELGYFATLDNAPHVGARYDAFRHWAQAHSLRFEAVGLDFEPDIRELEALSRAPAKTLWRWLGRGRDARRHAGVREAYAALVSRMRADGFLVETYQLPLLHDDRRAGGTLLQRVLGVFDVGADREVFMLYTSLMGPFAPALLESLGRECRAIGLGSTGGGIDTFPKLSWPELARDLRLAARCAEDLAIFSLEGCVEHGFLSRLRDFDFGAPVEVRRSHRLAAAAVRALLRAASAASRLARGAP